MGDIEKPRTLDELTEERLELRKKLGELNVEIDSLRDRYEEVAADMRGLEISVRVSESNQKKFEERLKEIEGQIAAAAERE